GGKGIFFSFHPDSIFVSVLPPKTIITSVFVNGKPFAFSDKPITFRSKQNDIAIQYTAVDLTDGPSTNYAYKLVVEDSAWMMAGHMRQINFSHLAPGKYTFLVRASTNGTNWSTQSANLSFYIKAPFTKTAWFYALLVLATGSIFFFLYRFRVRQLMKTEQIRR